MKNNYTDYVTLRVLFDWDNTIASWDDEKKIHPSDCFVEWSKGRKYCDFAWMNYSEFLVRFTPEDAKEFIDWYQQLMMPKTEQYCKEDELNGW